MTYMADRDNSEWEPILTEMVDKTIKILEKNPNGYLLLIEGECFSTCKTLTFLEMLLYD